MKTCFYRITGLVAVLVLAIGMTQCKAGKSRILPSLITKYSSLSEYQNDILQEILDLTHRSNTDFSVVLSKKSGSGTVSGFSYLFKMTYADHVSYLDYTIRTPNVTADRPFKSFDDGLTFKVLHACGIDDTHVEVVFNRSVNTVDGASTGLFAIPGLTVLGAAVDGTYGNIVLLTTDAQGDEADFTLTVDASFHDSDGAEIGGAGNTAAFKGFGSTALPAVRDVYMRSSEQIRVVYGSTPGSPYNALGNYTVSIKMDGVMRWGEDGSSATYPNVLSMNNYGILIAMEQQFDPHMAGYDSMLDFARTMGDNLVILGQAIVGKTGLDRRRSTDTFYLVKLYQLTDETKYLDQAEFNFDNEISTNSYGGSTGGEAWAKQMIAQRYDLAGYDAGFYMNSALALASVDKAYPGAKEFATACADYMIANEAGWRDLAAPTYGTNRLSVGAFCFYLTELARIYPDTKAAYSAKITEYATEVLSWRDVSGYWGMSSTYPEFDPQTTAFCLMALKGAETGYGMDASAMQGAIQTAEDYIVANYINDGTFMGGWYWDNDEASGLYNEPVSELIWALSI
ncbi:MAG: hypothetical protein KBC90_06630 [Spirochaetes bacterium]|nr:hypothetical protein [Spirochaetota bacterium]HOD13614.1 hypothetical protein [Spirochaetota bacterium]HPG51949.1 hypothetical protein [Spirochaetota bacterium]